ncbi:hypothetical protein COPEUT_00346 [Coprococcus eutactus ATCC 27759]|nr:hypothetical protein COPEUT_00346 [Coprococcus eutactus ATCC 27759]
MFVDFSKPVCYFDVLDCFIYEISNERIAEIHFSRILI